MSSMIRFTQWGSAPMPVTDHKTIPQEDNMAATGKMILTDLKAQLDKFTHAMDYAPGMDDLDFEVYRDLYQSLDATVMYTNKALRSLTAKRS